MNASTSNLGRFVRAVHRRHLVLRVVERAGLGLLGGCLVAIALVAVLLWRGQDAWAVAGAALGLGTLAGAVWGIMRRPTALASALEADRQLRTADLLATAWGMRERAATDFDDTFRQAVLALAAARCARVSPSSVLLHRLGVRAWGGIVLAVAFVATLAALSAGSPEAVAASGDAPALAHGARRDRAARPILEMTTETARQPRRADRKPADERTFGDESPKPTRDERPDSFDPRTDTDSPDKSGPTPGAGAADGRSNTPDVPNAQRPALAQRDVPSDSPPPQQGDPRGGAGRAARNPATGENNAGGTRTDDRPANSTPPWSHPSWPAAAEAAVRAVDAGRIADDYRDLVRGYFDRSISPDEVR